MRATRVIGLGLLNHAEVSLMNQRRWLQGVSRRLMAQIAPRDLTELLVNQGDDFIQSGLVAAAQPLQELGNLGHRLPHLGVRQDLEKSAYQASCSWLSDRQIVFPVAPI